MIKSVKSIIAMMLVLIFLTGCSSTPNSSSANKTDTAVEKTSIDSLDGVSDEDLRRQVIDYIESNPNEIEALPALPESGFNCGEINGLRTRTRALVTSLKWNLEKKTASLTVKSDIAQKIELTCPLSDKKYSVSFAAGEEKTVEFTLN